MSAVYIDPDGNEVDSPETQTLAGERLLDDICDAIAKYCVLPGEHEYFAVALYCAYTHLSDVFDFAPRLIIRSPQMRSGKTRLLEVIGEIARNPLHSVNATPATIFRSLDTDPNQTLMLDEVDAWFTGNTSESGNAIRGLINAGYQRGGYVQRMGGNNMTEVQRFTVFAPVVMAGIGKLPATIQDRSVVVMMRRKAPNEKVDKYRIRRDRPGLQKIHERVSEWSKDVRDVAKIYASNGIDIPVDDRQADVWEPLLIVAQLAGGNWPDTAREACKVMCANTDAEDSDSPDLLLLGDVRDIFGNATFIRSSELVSHLKMLHDSPWFDEMLTPAKLSSKLRGYGIHPRHSADKTRRGYYRADFRDTWIRYLSPENSSEPSEPSEAWGDQGFSADTFRSPDTVSDTQPVRDTSSDAAPSAQNPSSGAVPDTSDTSDASGEACPDHPHIRLHGGRCGLCIARKHNRKAL